VEPVGEVADRRIYQSYTGSSANPVRGIVWPLAAAWTTMSAPTESCPPARRYCRRAPKSRCQPLHLIPHRRNFYQSV